MIAARWLGLPPAAGQRCVSKTTTVRGAVVASLPGSIRFCTHVTLAP
jgi:hypothetical protein